MGNNQGETMDMKKIFYVLMISILLFSAISQVSADDDRSYSIDDAIVELTIGSNGLLHVDESYLYSFEGQYNGVYRDIPLKAGEKIENVKVSADGAYPVLEEYESNNEKHLKIYLYADAAHTKKIRDCDVKIYISYDMENVVNIFNDTGALQFKLWGDEWDVGVGHLTAIVHMPGSSGNTYYLNPQEFNASSSIEGDTITAETTSIPKGDFYELLLLMPLSDFDSDAAYAKHVDANGKEQIEKNLQDSIQSRAMWVFIFIALGLLSLLSPIIAVIVYLIYGREPKVDYEALYERELPTNHPPAVVNAMMKSHGIGTPDIHAFEASLLDLIDRKIIKLNVMENETTDTRDLILEFDKADTSDLESHERSVYNILNSLADNGRLNMSSLNSKLSSESAGKWFLEQLDGFYDTVKFEYLSDDMLKSYFNSRGNRIMTFLSIGGIIAAIILIILGIFTNLKAGLYTLVGGIFLLVFSIILIAIPDDIFGQWTPKGRLFYLKWKNFKKFLQDNSLIREHGPDSIVVWKKYLIYGTALGIADKVYESMKIKIPDYADFDDDILVYHYYGGYHLMHNAYDTGYSAAHPSDSGDFGGVGGGSGGGGGGAF